VSAPVAEPAGVRGILADRRVAAVIGLALLVMVGTGLVLPILPLYARSFGVGYGATGVLIGAYAAARLAADLGSGIVIRRFGERTSAASGLILMAGSAAATGLAPTFGAAVAFWTVSGIGSSVVFSAMYSHLIKLAPPGRMGRTLSVLYGAFNVGIVAGGFLSGVIAHELGLAAPLFFMAAVAFVTALLYLRFLPDVLSGPEQGSEPEKPRRRARDELGSVLRRPGFAMVLMTNLAYLWMIAAVVDTLLPLYADDEIGMSTVGIGIVLALLLAVEFVVLYPAGAIADRRGRKVVMVPSLAALAVATAAIGWTESALAFGLAAALLGIPSGFAGVPPAAMLADVVPRRESPVAVGVFRFAGDLGFTIGPLAAGFVASALGFKAAFAVTAIPTVVALLFVLATPETLRRQPEPVVAAE
jgi:MFS family permease